MASNDVTDFPDDELSQILKKTAVGSLNLKLVNGTVITEPFGLKVEEVLNFKVRDDDIVVCTFPKSGTTWLQEMVWCIKNEVNLEKATTIDLNERFPYFEFSCLLSKDTEEYGKIPEHMVDSLEYLKKLEESRFIKTHLPLHLLPRGLQSPDRNAKLLYVCRDPRDACISFYHHRQFLFDGSFDEYVKLFLGDRVAFGPYWKHVLPFWKNRHQRNLLFVTYEDMKKDLPSVIRRVADFLDESLTPEHVASLADHLSFTSMKNNKAVNGDLKDNGKLHSSFLRKGQSGGFKRDMTPEQIEAFDGWIKKNVKGTDFVLPNN